MLTILAEQPPLTTTADDVIRIGETRVTLETVIAAFNEGATSEEIAQQYPALRLADVYATIAYYLNHKTEVNAYLRLSEQSAAQVQAENETRFNPIGVRERLLARRQG
jgi:uncharacterized protein (DUF433 family)